MEEEEEEEEESEGDEECTTSSSFGTVVSSDFIVRWDPYTVYRKEKNTEGYPMIRLCNLESLAGQVEFDVEINKQSLRCTRSNNYSGRLAVSEADVRYNCCPVYLKGTNSVLGIYFCNNIRSVGYCFLNVQGFIQTDLPKMTQLPLRSLIEFSRDYVFVEFLTEGSTVYQCRKTKKFVKQEHSLPATFQLIGTCRIRFVYVGENEPTEIETSSLEERNARLQMYPSQQVHPLLGCIVCDFYEGDHRKQETTPQNREDQCYSTTKEQKEYVSYFPQGAKLTLRKQIKKELLSQWN